MKCKVCGGLAVINQPYHNTALCKQHFLAWVPRQMEKANKQYSMLTAEDRILVAVSGGKDSLALWDILLNAGYHTEGLFIHLGIDSGTGYSRKSLEYARKFAESRDSNLHILDFETQYHTDMRKLSRLRWSSRDKPCQVCGLIKRHEMNRMALKMGFNVLATGHNLDDEAAALLGNTLRWNSQYLKRQAPVLEARQDGFVRKVKPLVRLYEREITAYCLLNGIDYIMEECPHADGAQSAQFKRVINELDSNSPGTKLAFYNEFQKAKQAGLFADQMSDEEYTLEPCRICGQPTSANGLCAFCRLLEQQTQQLND